MSNIPTHHTFSIENTKIPGTEKIYGPSFAGSFVIRRPNIGDKQSIAVRQAATINARGAVNPAMVSESIDLLTNIFAFVETVAEHIPEWFDKKKLFAEKDESAVFTVWREVSRWLEESFPSNEIPRVAAELAQTKRYWFRQNTISRQPIRTTSQ